MPISSVAAFWTVSFLLVIVPGADWSYAISAGLRHRTVVPAISGLLVGYLALTIAVAAGIAALVATSPHLLSVLTLAGGAYLLWLGITLLTRPPAQPQANAAQTAPNAWIRNALKGLGTSALNPKGLLVFLALLPQFTDPVGNWPLPIQIMLLGAVHIASCAVVYTAVGTGARAVLTTRPSAAQIVSRASGIAMVVIGIVLVLERFVG